MTCGECANVTAPGAGFPNHVYCKRFLLPMEKREDASRCRDFIPKPGGEGRMMNVLVACEESQEVCKAFRAKGHRAFSCDLQECSGGHPEWHIQENVLEILEPRTKFDWNDTIEFETADGEYHIIDGKWDLIIAHPPCTDLAVSGARWFPEKQKDFRQQKAVVFFMQMMLANCDKIAVENPIGIMSTVYRKPDQIIQPFQFGHQVRKATCLWLKNLTPLIPTDVVDPGELDENGFTIGSAMRWATDENGNTLKWNDPRTAKARSRTFPGIAKAMSDQWG